MNQLRFREQRAVGGGVKKRQENEKTLNRESSQRGISRTSNLVKNLKGMKKFFNLRCRLFFFLGALLAEK